MRVTAFAVSENVCSIHVTIEDVCVAFRFDYGLDHPEQVAREFAHSFPTWRCHQPTFQTLLEHHWPRTVGRFLVYTQLCSEK
jgi:hypothetical protein